MSSIQDWSDDDMTVEVEVGPDKCCYKLSKQLLCLKSPFFRAALDKEFQESKSGRVWLKELDLKAFIIFKEWLYTGEMKRRDADLNDDEYREEWELDLNLYRIAEFLIIPDLQNRVMDVMIDRSGYSLVPGTPAQKTWDQTISPQLRRFLLEVFVSEQRLSSTIKSSDEVLSKDFLYEIANELSSSVVIPSGRPLITVTRELPERCIAYHVHDDGSECE